MTTAEFGAGPEADADVAGDAPITVEAVALGAPGRLEPKRCSALAIRSLIDGASPGMKLDSFSLEMGSAVFAADHLVTLDVTVDKKTHAIAFVSLEARSADVLAFTARAVFSLAG
ncbi:MAG: hypothetical protein GC155_14400 [Alphaproteobacteria bacterium]|nr:hypothetical protein [Alphaproteobacteria bacterium]